MAYTGDPLNNPIDALRLSVGDIWPDIELLQDADYEYFLIKNKNNNTMAMLEAAKVLLFKLSRFTRERTGDIEVYGDSWYKNFKSALELLLKDPNMTLFSPMPYAGGISKSDMAKYTSDPDAVLRQIRIGSQDKQILAHQDNRIARPPNDNSQRDRGRIYP